MEPMVWDAILALRDEFFLPWVVFGPGDPLEFLRLASILADEDGFLGANSPALSGCVGSRIVPPPESGGPITKFDAAPAVVLCQVGPRECRNLTLLRA